MSTDSDVSVENLNRFRLMCEGLGVTWDKETGSYRPGSDAEAMSWRALIERLYGAVKGRGYTPAAWDSCLAQLEARWGEGLFHDLGRNRHQLTPKGCVYYARTLAVLDALECLRGQVASPSRSVILGGYNSFLGSYVPEALKLQRTRVDNQESRPVRVAFRDLTFSGIVEAVGHRTVDLAVGSVPIRDREKIDREVVVVGVGYVVTRGVIFPKGHRFGQKKSLSLEDLAGETVYRLPPEPAVSGLNDWTHAVTRAGGDVVVVTAFDMAVQFVLLGLGVAIAPELPGVIGSAVQRREVGFLPLDELGQAEVAIFLPRGGEDALWGDAKILFGVLKDYFKNAADAPPAKTPRRADKRPR